MKDISAVLVSQCEGAVERTIFTLCLPTKSSEGLYRRFGVIGAALRRRRIRCAPAPRCSTHPSAIVVSLDTWCVCCTTRALMARLTPESDTPDFDLSSIATRLTLATVFKPSPEAGRLGLVGRAAKSGYSACRFALRMIPHHLVLSSTFSRNGYKANGTHLSAGRPAACDVDDHRIDVTRLDLLNACRAGEQGAGCKNKK
jgi:hypothetical protein